MSDQETESMPDRGSPVPGCLILSAIILVFGGLIILYVVIGVIQTNRIDTFTDSSPVELPVANPEPEEQGGVLNKLQQIESAASEGRAERILFSAEELNVMLATLDATKDFSGQTWVEAITSEGIVARTAQPMRKGIIDKGVRYLNGTFVFEPELRRKTINFKVKDIDADKGEVPEGFIQNYGVIDLFRLDPKNEHIEANIGSIAAIYSEDGALVVETGVRKEE